MGAGYHGNFGKTYGSDVKVFYKLGSKGESYKNYTKKRKFQIAKGNHVDFLDENDMLVHIWKNYKRS